MFHFIYKWLYERSQKREAFKLPTESHGKMGLGFGDYISGQSRIGSMGAYDLLHRRKRRLKWIFAAIITGVIVWLGVELVHAVRFYGS
ncbi:MAG: hypothetical protein AAGB06_00260 [Verrucomicrobiota bacterium]